MKPFEIQPSHVVKYLRRKFALFTPKRSKVRSLARSTIHPHAPSDRRPGGRPRAKPPTTVIARSVATKQSSFSIAARKKLDCFASLAMTGKHACPLSRHDSVRVVQIRCPSFANRGRRESRAQTAPAAWGQQEKAHQQVHHRFSQSPDFPRARENKKLHEVL